MSAAGQPNAPDTAPAAGTTLAAGGMRLNGGSLLACLLAGLSGAAALAWQGLWTLQFSASLGHEFVAVMGVVAAIFLGLSAGAWWFGAAAARSLRPWWWYALLEGVIGAWGALLCVVLPALAPWLSPLVGEQPSPLIHGLLAFAVPGLLLLPATTAMGATLPVMVRQLAGDARALERIYAANTAGAVIGVLAAVFWIVPGLGLRAAGLTIAGMNLACALVAVIAWRSSTIADQAPDAAAHGATGADRRLPLLALRPPHTTTLSPSIDRCAHLDRDLDGSARHQVLELSSPGLLCSCPVLRVDAEAHGVRVQVRVPRVKGLFGFHAHDARLREEGRQRRVEARGRHLLRGLHREVVAVLV
jgi:hypothetical protein